MVRAAPCDRLVRRREHQPHQPDPGLQLSPPPVRPTRLAMCDQPRRSPGLDPTEVDRPATTTDPERPDHHQQLGSPGSVGLQPTRGRRSARPSTTIRLTTITIPRSPPAAATATGPT